MRVKSEERRQAILEIASKLFTENGFEQTSMAQIARKVGGSKATLYNYFDSKETIFAAVMESSATEGISAAFMDLAVGKPVEQALNQFGCNYLASILTPSLAAIHKMAITEADRSDIGRHFYLNGPKKGWTRISQYFALLKQQGKLNVEDESLAALQFKALLEAELLDPFRLGVIGKPDQDTIEQVVNRAIVAFLTIYPLGDF